MSSDQLALTLIYWTVIIGAGLICLGATLKVFDIAKDIRKIREAIESKQQPQHPNLPEVKTQSARRT